MFSVKTMTLYKFAGMATGIVLMALAVAWSQDLICRESGATILFFGAALVFLGSTKQVVSERGREWKN